MADRPGTGLLPYAPTLRQEAEAWNNNHRAYIARRLIEEMPGLAGLLSTRRTRS